MIFHICTREALDAAHTTGSYRADSLDREGFIHLSQAHQVLPTARAYFADAPELVVLAIDPAKLSSRLVYEPPAPLPSAAPKPPGNDLYPHCYGPIDLAAIVEVIELDRFDGTVTADRHHRSG